MNHSPELSQLLHKDGVSGYGKYEAFQLLNPESDVTFDEFLSVYEKELWRQAWVYRQAQRPPEAPQAPPALRIEEAQAQLSQSLQGALHDGGRYCFHVDCGTGKTHGAALSCFELWGGALLKSMEHTYPHIVFVVPTNKLAVELETKLRHMAPLHMSSHAAESFEVELVQAPKRTRENCQRFDVMSAAHRVHHRAARALCKSCPHRDGCPFLAQVKQPRGHITIMTHELAFSYLPGRDVDLVVLDEGIMDVMFPIVSMGLHQLAKLKEQANIALHDSAWAKLTDLMTRGTNVGSIELAEALPPDSLLLQSDEYVHELITQAQHAPVEEQLALLEQAPSLDAVHILRHHIQSSWSGASIQAGKLCLTHQRPLALERARTVLYLDATTSPLHARAVLGDTHHMVRVPVQLPEHVTIEQVYWSWSKNIVRYGQVRHAINGRRIHALVQRYDSPSTAWVVHKDHRTCDEIASYLAQAEQDNRVIHYGAARGSNAYEDFDTIVVVARHLPEAAIEARAELLHALTGAPWLQCWDEAVYVLEQGEMIQAAHRVRPTRSTSPVRIVVVDDREPLPGLPITEESSIDVMVMDELQEIRGAECHEMLAWRHLQAHDVLIPAQIKACDTQGGRFPIRSMGNLPPCVSHDEVTLWSHGQTFLDHVHNAWSNNWTKFAAQLYVSCTYVATSAGGRPLAVLHRQDVTLTPDVLASSMRQLGVSWYELEGRKVWLSDQRYILIEATIELARKSDASYAGLAQVCGVSERTIRRWMKLAELTIEELHEVWEMHQVNEVLEKAVDRQTFMRPVHEKTSIPRDTIKQRVDWNSGPAPPDMTCCDTQGGTCG